MYDPKNKRKSKVSPAQSNMILDLIIANPGRSSRKTTKELKKHFMVQLSNSTVRKEMQTLKAYTHDLAVLLAGFRKTPVIKVPAAVQLLTAGRHAPVTLKSKFLIFLAVFSRVICAPARNPLLFFYLVLRIPVLIGGLAIVFYP